MKKTLLALPMVVGIMMLGATIAKAQAPSATGAHEVRYAITTDTPTSMPGDLLRNGYTDEIFSHVVESLVALKADLSVAPMLADSWDISPDGKRYTFHLRHGVTFQNGEAFTSANVKWSYDFFMNPKSGFSCRGFYDGRTGPKVLSVTTPDPFTVVFNLNRPSALFLNRMAERRCPLAALSSASVDHNGQWLKPIGTGPFQLSEWRRNQYILLTPFPGYRPRSEPFSGQAGSKRAEVNVRFVIIPDQAAQLAAFMAGQIDVESPSSDDLPPPDPAWRIVNGPGADPAVILMQTRDPLLSDVHMRKAIALAVDLPLVVKAVTDGEARYNPSLIPDADENFTPADAVGYTRNLAEVKALLGEAGYKGQTIRMETSHNTPHIFNTAIYTQSLLTQAGIRVKLDVVEPAKQVEDYLHGRFQMMSSGYSARIEPSIMFDDILGNKDRRATVQWENPKAEEILRSLDTVTDPGQRKKIFAQLHAMMLEDVPMIVLNDTPDVMLVSNRVHGITSWPLRMKRFFNVSKD